MEKTKISKKIASQKYGVITTGANSLYSYYLLKKGNVVDSSGDIRFLGENLCMWCSKFPKQGTNDICESCLEDIPF